MSAEYIRCYYGVSFKRGERVVVDGRPGVIVSFPAQYLGVRFDGQKTTSRCHPTWRVERETTKLSDPAIEAAKRAWEDEGTRPRAVLAAAREALAPIREWWENGNGRNYDDLLKLIYPSEEL